MSLVTRFADAHLDWIVPSWCAPSNVRGFATTRNGGVSEAAVASLDVGPAHLKSLDAVTLAAVMENRRRVEAFLPAPPVWLEQVHGNAVACVDATNVAAFRASPPTADAAVTRLAGVPLGVRVADCLPVLFADDGGTMVAAAHVGWRGLAAGVLEATLKAMAVPPGSINAWLGPAIGAQAFEVGVDVHDALCKDDHGAEQHFLPRGDGKWLADLAALARRRLRAGGVLDIDGDGSCTHADAARFFSYRRDRSIGRMAALVWRSDN